MSTSCNGILNEKMNINHNTTHIFKHYVSTCQVGSILWVFNDMFSNILVIPCWSVLLVLGNVVPGMQRKPQILVTNVIKYYCNNHTTQCLRVKLTNFIDGGCCLNTKKTTIRRVSLSCPVCGEICFWFCSMSFFFVFLYIHSYLM